MRRVFALTSLMLAFIASLLLFFGCSEAIENGEEPKKDETPFLTIEQELSESQRFDKDGGQFDLSFSTNVDWKIIVTEDAGWLSVSQSFGKAGKQNVRITIEQNESYEERKATVTLRAGELSKSYVVTQGFMELFAISSSSVSIDASSQTFDITVTSNVEYNVAISDDNSDWLHYMDNTKSAPRDSVMTFAVDRNESVDSRTGVIEFTDGNTTLELVVTQSGEYYTGTGTVNKLKDEGLQYLSEIVEEGNILTFNENTPDEVLPKIGTSILVPESEKTPYGFLGRVTSVTKDGGFFKVQTETVALNEAFPDLSIDTTFNILDNIEGVFDEDGNPVEYSIYDDIETETRADGEFDWKTKKLKINIPKEASGNEYSVFGSIDLSFEGSEFYFDDEDETRQMRMVIAPKFSADIGITAKIKGQKKESRTKPLYIKGRVVAGPVILPIRIPISVVFCMQGELTTSLHLCPKVHCKMSLSYENGKWSHEIIPLCDKRSPWVINEFDFNGEIYAGLDVSCVAGIYTTEIGVGGRVLPKFGIEASANLSSLNPFSFNPLATIYGKIESELFCMAKLFGKGWKEFKLPLPEVNLYSRSLSLFPNITNFIAKGGTNSGTISYQSDSYYFLQGLGAKTGLTIYDSDKTSVIKTLYPEHTSIDNNGIRYYNTNVTGLDGTKTYYAAPVITWLGHSWTGEKYEFKTSSGYNVDFTVEYPKYSFSSPSEVECEIAIKPVFKNDEQRNDIINSYAILYKDGEEVKRKSYEVSGISGRILMRQKFKKEELSIDYENYIAIPKEGRWQVRMAFDVINERGDTINVKSDIIKDVTLKYDTKPILIIPICRIIGEPNSPYDDKGYHFSVDMGYFVKGTFWCKSWHPHSVTCPYDDYFIGHKGGVVSRYPEIAMGFEDYNGRMHVSNRIPIMTDSQGHVLDSYYDYYSEFQAAGLSRQWDF